MTGIKNIAGRRYGKLIAVKLVGHDQHGRLLWRFKCDCGGGRDTAVNNLRATSSRGRCPRPRRDITGQRFGMLVAIGPVGRTKTRKVIIWAFHCDCGGEYRTTLDHLRYKGNCGCIPGGRVKHGHLIGGRRTKVYRAWKSMLNRCHCPTSRRWADYDGRGISVADEWRHSFANFFRDVGLPPSRFHSLDRIDVNGNYERSNCRWATIFEQANNRRDSNRIELLPTAVARLP
jgi:hypothetical protein